MGTIHQPVVVISDIKYRHGVRFVVLNQLGRPESGVTADEGTLELVLRDLAGQKLRSFH